MTAMALHPHAGLRVANLNYNPLALTQRQWFAALAACGLRADPQTAAEWQRRLADLEPSNGLALIRDFYTGDLSAAPLPIEQIGTVTALARHGVDSDSRLRCVDRALYGISARGGLSSPVAGDGSAL